MYSKDVIEFLKSKNISIGDRVRITRNDHVYEGILLQHPGTDSNILMIKLDNGYNVGLEFNDSLELASKGNIKPAPAQEEIPGDSLKILMYGGTIASKVEYKTGAVHPSITPSEFEEMFPGINRWGRVGLRSLRNILSEDMSPAHWADLAAHVYEELKEDRPVVITHGTDTMGFTAAALSFAISGIQKPMVLTGAQRSSDRGSSDNLENLMNSVYFAHHGIPGVFVVMHATSNDGPAHVHLGTRVRKMHTSRRDAFKSIDVPPVATINFRTESLKFHWKPEFANTQGNLSLNNKFSENVALIYIHPGIQPKMIEHLREYDGVVLAGTGLGHASTNPFNDSLSRPILNEISELISSGIPVVMAPQTIFGRVNLEVYTAGRLLKEAGVIGHLCDWTPDTAYVKLSWVLGQTMDLNKVRELMLKNIAGECLDKSVYLEK